MIKNKRNCNKDITHNMIRKLPKFNIEKLNNKHKIQNKET